MTPQEAGSSLAIHGVLQQQVSKRPDEREYTSSRNVKLTSLKWNSRMNAFRTSRFSGREMKSPSCRLSRRLLCFNARRGLNPPRKSRRSQRISGSTCCWCYRSSRPALASCGISTTSRVPPTLSRTTVFWAPQWWWPHGSRLHWAQLASGEREGW